MSVVAPAILTVPAKTGDGVYFEAKWRARDGQQVKRRLGRAWREWDPTAAEWRKRRGRTPPGWLDDRTVHVAAAAMVAQVEREAQEAAQEAASCAVVTFRRVSREWLEWKRDVKGGAPSTLQNDEYRLAEPGTPHKRGPGKSDGRIMAAFGDEPVDTITVHQINDFLKGLDKEGFSARNVNAHRSMLHAIFNYAMKPTTYALASNPVAGTDVRHEEDPPPLDHYEVHEVEALALACERGEQRGKPPNYKGRPMILSDEERAARAAEDQQDADLFRVKFYSGMRIGEVTALRRRYVRLLPDLSGAIIYVERAISAGVEKMPKSGHGRPIPVGRAGAEALARSMARDEFNGPDDYVYCSRQGERLDASAVRRRYKRAATAAGLRAVTLHGLRHAAGSILARTLPLVAVRDILGHSELSTTNRYLHSKVDLGAIAAVNAAFDTATHEAAFAA